MNDQEVHKQLELYMNLSQEEKTTLSDFERASIEAEKLLKKHKQVTNR
jgi:hypothetical protein